MNKKELLKFLDLAAATIFINAFIFTFLFQFSSQALCLFVALWSYLAASVIFVAMSILRLVFSKIIKDDEYFLLSKKKKALVITNLILCITICIAVTIILIAL